MITKENIIEYMNEKYFENCGLKNSKRKRKIKNAFYTGNAVEYILLKIKYKMYNPHDLKDVVVNNAFNNSIVFKDIILFYKHSGERIFNHLSLTDNDKKEIRKRAVDIEGPIRLDSRLGLTHNGDCSFDGYNLNYHRMNGFHGGINVKSPLAFATIKATI